MGLPYAAGTVTALRGRETWKPDGPGTWRLQLPATVAARQHVAEDHQYSLILRQASMSSWPATTAATP